MKSLFAPLLLALAMFGCATNPTSTQTELANTAIDLAVAVAIQEGTDNAADWQVRAVRVMSIASQLEAVASADSATLVAVTNAVGPLLNKAGLSPVERVAANRLVILLANEIKRRVPADSQAVVQIRAVLAEVKSVASAYL